MLIYFYIITITLLSTNDTFSIEILSNKLNYCFKSEKDSILYSFSIGWNSQLIAQNNHLIDSFLTNQSTEFNYYKINQKSTLKLYADFFLFGYKKNNYSFNLFLNEKYLKISFLTLSANMKKFKPVFEINTFQSNHHIWDNNQMIMFYFGI